jgi:lipoate-protein ligase A
MDRARQTGEGVVAIYGWARPTLSLGRNQTAIGVYDSAKIRDLGMDVVRRPTGGRALVHHREVTYSVSGPSGDLDSLHLTYDAINTLLIAALARLGVTAAASTASGPAERPGTLPCFAIPSEGELVAGGAKLVGSAQVREDSAFLQHGSILIEDDQSLLSEIMIRREVTPVPPPATLAGLLGRVPDRAEVAGAIFETVRDLWDANVRGLSEEEAKVPAARYIERYSSELWTYRR